MLALSTLNKIQEGHSPSEYATSTCLMPKRIKVRLAETGALTDIFCDCGKCARCLDNRRNELASRMFLHSLDYEYVYFVTLTYGSYNLLPFERHPFLADWLQTCPSYDDCNSNSRKTWTPSILVTSHLTKYLKRLRASLNDPISYAACGEYGEKFGRPHWHLIVWSHKQITAEQFSNAWSLECKRTDKISIVRPWRESENLKTKENGYFRFRLGKVDVHDLWANGSLNFDGKHCGVIPYDPNNKNNAMHNFTYVAKYIGKNDPFTWRSHLCLGAINRIQRAYNMYTRNIDQLAKINPSPADYELNLYNSLTLSINYDSTQFDKIDFLDFSKIISPCFFASRRPALGKNYFVQNRARFLSDFPTLPKFMGKQISFPSYFKRLIAQEKYPLRLRKVVASGISPSKDYFPRLYEYYLQLRYDRNYWYYIRGNRKNSLSTPDRDRIQYYQLSNIIEHGTVEDVDFLDAAGHVIHYVYNPIWEIFEGYIYDFSLKDYIFYEYVERLDFCDYVLNLLQTQFDQYKEKFEQIEQRFILMNTILEDPQSDEEIDKYLSIRNHMQRIYNVEHKQIF